MPRESEPKSACGTRENRIDLARCAWCHKYRLDSRGIKGDDTDGHIDDIARFVSRDTIVALRAPVGHPDHDVLEENWEVLQAARDERGERFRIVALPVPNPIEYEYPADRFGPGGRSMIPASHANFLLSNGTAFVPILIRAAMTKRSKFSRSCCQVGRSKA